MIRTVIAERIALIRAGLVACISQERDIEVVAELDRREPVVSTVSSLRPDVAVIDDDIAGHDGFAVIQALQGQADVDKDGFVTAREMYPWVRDYVSSEARAVLGTTVTPLFKDLDRLVSKGEFVFTKAK